MAKPFEFPWEYSFPPFFTIQPNAETRAKQLATWAELVLAYARHHKLQQLDLAEAAKSELFDNAALQRRLPPAGIRAVLDHLVDSGNVEWLPGTDKKQCLVMWRSPQQWADMIYKWAAKTGHLDSVVTLFELREGDTGEGAEFYQMDKLLFAKALEALQAKGKAEVFHIGEQPDELTDSVKFFV